MAKRPQKVVHVIGVGTIGEPLIGLLTSLKDKIGINEVTFHKRTPSYEDRPKIRNLVERGAKLCVDPDTRGEFEKLGYQADYDALEALERASVVVDCTPKGVGHKNKQQYYDKYRHNTLGFIAQGSEFGFGKMYAQGINDEALIPGEDQYLQVVSCNTHNIAAIVKTLGFDAHGKKDILEEGRFLLIRRANDISQDTDFVPSPRVGKHDDALFGTHHARDAYHLFETLNMKLNLFSSSMIVNSQYMHTMWFNLRLKEKTTLEEVKNRFVENERVAITYKRSANSVFSFGRDHGYYGRIFSQAVVSIPTLQVVNGGWEVVGFCFTPQDGNSLLSTLSAILWFLYPEDWTRRLNACRPYYFQEV